MKEDIFEGLWFLVIPIYPIALALLLLLMRIPVRNGHEMSQQYCDTAGNITLQELI